VFADSTVGLPGTAPALGEQTDAIIAELD
jgi:hypothetical protein